MAWYYGFSFPQSFFLGDQEWFERLGVQTNPDEFDPFEDGLDEAFGVLHSVLKGIGPKGIQGGCYMFNHDVPPFLVQLGLVNAFLESVRTFKTRWKSHFESIVHVSTRRGDFPLEGRYLEVFGNALRSCTIIHSKTLVVHPPEGNDDVSRELVDLLTSDPFIKQLTSTDTIVSIENGLHAEFFGSLENVLQLLHELADKLNERGHGPLSPRFTLCLDTGHLLLWRYHHEGGRARADKDIENVLPGYIKNTSVYHVKACGSGKEYIVPHARKGAIFEEHSSKVIEWLETSKTIDRPFPKLVCMEIPKRNFVLQEIVDFGRAYL